MSHAANGTNIHHESDDAIIGGNDISRATRAEMWECPPCIAAVQK